MTTARDPWHAVEAAASSDRHRNYLDDQRARLDAVVEAVAEHHTGGRIVEAGAAPHLLQLLLAERFDDAEVVGLDLDPERHAAFADRHDLDVRQCDLLVDEPPVDSADVVVCAEVIEHLADPLAALERLADVLAPAGTIVVTTPNLYRLESRLRWHLGRGFDDALSQYTKGVGHPGHMRLFSASQVRDLLTAAGFDVERSQYRRFGASHRGGLAGAVLTTLYRAVPPLAPYQLHVATIGGGRGGV